MFCTCVGVCVQNKKNRQNGVFPLLSLNVADEKMKMAQLVVGLVVEDKGDSVKD